MQQFVVVLQHLHETGHIGIAVDVEEDVALLLVAVENFGQHSLVAVDDGALEIGLEAREFVIYGAGACGRSVAAAAKSRGLLVRAFLDARAAELQTVDATDCLDPESDSARALAREGIPVIVAVFNFAADLRPIFQSLKTIGFKRTLTFYEIFEHFEFEPQFWLTKRSFYAFRADEILAGFDLLGDDTSRRVFCDTLGLRLTFNTALLADPDRENHYLPLDLPPTKLPLRMIDGGAFDGDTIESFVARTVQIEALAAFEPDRGNFSELRRCIGRVQSSVRDAILFPCGLSSEIALRGFASGGGAASSLQADGDTHIQVVALDAVLPTFAPNFIKLDIEGVEPEALRGAHECIARFGPRLAVSIYHAPEHLWTLPRLVREIYPDYRLALRYHQFNGFDTVLYAFRE